MAVVSRRSPMRVLLLAGVAAAAALESLHSPISGPGGGTDRTVNLMSAGLLGNFESDQNGSWPGYACTFSQWTACVSLGCGHPQAPCSLCTAKRGTAKKAITCTRAPTTGQSVFSFPAGGIFPVTEQFALPPNTHIVGAADPNDPSDKTRQQVDVPGQTWFVVPRGANLCGGDPMCRDVHRGAKGMTACVGDPKTHRQGFLMASNTTLMNINFQGADLGRAGSEGTLCGPGAIELPGCLSGTGCKDWGDKANGHGVVQNVVVRNVRLSDAVLRAEVARMGGNCANGEALDSAGKHVRAHQVSVWVAKLPDSEHRAHANVQVDNLVSMNSRADGFNVHGAVHGLTLENSHIENSGDDCIGIWSAGIANM
eukprot:SAG22_NODE_118_length_19263_cov_16.155813_18_plen_368_part_00